MKLVIIFLLCSVVAQAQTLEDFFKLSDKMKMEFLEKKTKYTDGLKEVKRISKANPGLLKKVENKAEYIAGLWGDTILEGPYAQLEDAKSRINAFYTANGKIFAVDVEVFAPGVYTEQGDECEYNDDTETWVGCDEGEISQNFVMDFRGNIISEGYADIDW